MDRSRLRGAPARRASPSRMLLELSASCLLADRGGVEKWMAAAGVVRRFWSPTANPTTVRFALVAGARPISRSSISTSGRLWVRSSTSWTPGDTPRRWLGASGRRTNRLTAPNSCTRISNSSDLWSIRPTLNPDSAPGRRRTRDTLRHRSYRARRRSDAQSGPTLLPGESPELRGRSRGLTAKAQQLIRATHRLAIARQAGIAPSGPSHAHPIDDPLRRFKSSRCSASYARTSRSAPVIHPGIAMVHDHRFCRRPLGDREAVHFRLCRRSRAGSRDHNAARGSVRSRDSGPRS